MKNRIIVGVLAVLLLCGASMLHAQRSGRGGARLIQILDSKSGNGESGEIAKDIPIRAACERAGETPWGHNEKGPEPKP